jgi:hypothetical protein
MGSRNEASIRGSTILTLDFSLQDPSEWNSNRLRRKTQMLWTIFVVLLVLWLLGLVTSTTMGGFIHILLVLAIAVVLIRVIQGRKSIA